MLRIPIPALLLFVIIASVPERAAGRPAGIPKFVVPDVPDLTIWTRRTADRPNSTIVTEIVRPKRCLAAS